MESERASGCSRSASQINKSFSRNALFQQCKCVVHVPQRKVQNPGNFLKTNTIWDDVSGEILDPGLTNEARRNITVFGVSGERVNTKAHRFGPKGDGSESDTVGLRGHKEERLSSNRRSRIWAQECTRGANAAVSLSPEKPLLMLLKTSRTPFPTFGDSEPLTLRLSGTPLFFPPSPPPLPVCPCCGEHRDGLG